MTDVIIKGLIDIRFFLILFLFRSKIQEDHAQEHEREVNHLASEVFLVEEECSEDE